jgi:hypothetical protein
VPDVALILVAAGVFFRREKVEGRHDADGAGPLRSAMPYSVELIGLPAVRRVEEVEIAVEAANPDNAVDFRGLGEFSRIESAAHRE